MEDEEPISIAQLPSPFSPEPTIPAQEPLPPLLRLVSGEDFSCINIASPCAEPRIREQGIATPAGNPQHSIQLSEDVVQSKPSSADVSQRSSSSAEHEVHPLRKQSSAMGISPLNPKLAELKGGASLQNLSGELSPASRGVYRELGRKVSFASRLQGKSNLSNGASNNEGSPRAQPSPIPQQTRQKAPPKRKFFSQPMPARDKPGGGLRARKASASSGPVRRYSTPIDAGGSVQLDEADFAKKANYVMFRTRSSKFESQSFQRQSRESPRKGDEPNLSSQSTKDEVKAMPAGRYFDALKGAELEIVKDSEELLLPLNQKWPFLLRYPIGCFGVCLGLGSQAVLYKVLATSPATGFLHIPLAVNFALWCLALMSLVVVSIIYGLKCLLYFEAVRREYYHPVRVNFFFAPWIAGMFLTVGMPPRIGTSIHPAVWCILTVPLLLLKLKIYGQWLSGGQRRLSKVANPSTHLSLVGNFVSAMLAAIVGWDEPALFFWAVGCAHYLVLFVTLYQRLPTAEVLPQELHPVFFLFVAAPSVASVAWKNISGSFDRVSRIAYFLALFLYSSLVVRANFFRGFQFSIAWWAYTFPTTASAIATINYAVEVRHPITKGMAVLLSCISSLVVLSVFVTTLYHMLRGSLFPNDVAIAIRRRRRKKQKGPKVDPQSEKMWKKDADDSTKLCMENDHGAIVACLQDGLISVASDPFPVCANATHENAAQEV